MQIADFTRLRQAGTYYLDVPGVGRSWTFSIGRDVFSRPYYLAMRAFYGQRCGTAVDLGPEFPGYTHAACHLKGEFHSSSGKQGERDNIGGWHDAGDYGRYIVNSGITTGTLLWTWEIYGPKLKSIKLNIPESGNGTPDILNEARWNLEWMLKMQDDDGGVWHKQTSELFPVSSCRKTTTPERGDWDRTGALQEHLCHGGPGSGGRDCRARVSALRCEVCRAQLWKRRARRGSGRRRIPT